MSAITQLNKLEAQSRKAIAPVENFSSPQAANRAIKIVEPLVAKARKIADRAGFFDQHEANEIAAGINADLLWLEGEANRPFQTAYNYAA